MASGDTRTGDNTERFTEPNLLPVFTETEGDLIVTLLPRFNRGRVQWAIQLASSETEQVEYESNEGITDAAVTEFSISTAEQERLNRLRKFARRNVDLQPVLANRTRQEFELSELETVMGDWTP
jgi:hypothetical protein